MEGQRHIVEHVFAYQAVVFFEVVEEGFFVA